VTPARTRHVVGRGLDSWALASHVVGRATATCDWEFHVVEREEATGVVVVVAATSHVVARVDVMGVRLERTFHVVDRVDVIPGGAAMMEGDAFGVPTHDAPTEEPSKYALGLGVAVIWNPS
jgi:hypothetical protein